jgi:hypothetical protein
LSASAFVVSCLNAVPMIRSTSAGLARVSVFSSAPASCVPRTGSAASVAALAPSSSPGPLTFLSYAFVALPTSPMAKPRFFSSSAVCLARPLRGVALKTLTVTWPGFGRVFGLAEGDAEAFVRQSPVAPAAEALSPPPVKTSISCRVPQPIRPTATAEATTASTILLRPRLRRIRGYLSPVMRYLPPMPGGVSMLMGAA